MPFSDSEDPRDSKFSRCSITNIIDGSVVLQLRMLRKQCEQSKEHSSGVNINRRNTLITALDST